MSKNLIAAIVGIIVMFGIVVFVDEYVNNSVADKLETTVLTLDTHIAQQELLLVTVADLTNQLGADEVTQQIVVDCPASERQRFDQLLNQLSGTISNAELKELDVLFYKCGSYYADRKLVMAARLLREVEVYKDYLTLRANILGPEEEQLAKLANWEQVAEMEMKLAEHFSTLVDMQGQIILTLLAGKSRTSPEITETLATVSDARSHMAVLTQQIEKVRTELRPI